MFIRVESFAIRKRLRKQEHFLASHDIDGYPTSACGVKGVRRPAAMKCFRRILTLALALATSPYIVCQDASSENRETISPDDQTVASHLVGPVPVVRMDFQRFPELAEMGGVPIEVLVDEQGNVLSAEMEGYRESRVEQLPNKQMEIVKAVVAAVENAGTKLQFRPFEDAGHPARARFALEIPLRPLEEKSGKHTPFPEIHDWNSPKIELSRTGCFGTCPSYAIEVHGDGTVLYTGSAFVAVTGQHRASISRDAVAQMVEAFRAADYFSLEDKYRWGATDLPTYVTSITIDGKTKKVVDYAGQRVGMPESVSKLEIAIDRLSGVERWTKGNAETVAALTEENFDFNSPLASEILANVSQMGDATAVRELVAAGVMISEKPNTGQFRAPGTALENAALRGDVEMLRTLLDGIKSPEAKTDALASAAGKGKIDAMRLLIQSGASPIVPDVIIGAAASGVPAALVEVLKYKPNVNARDQNDETALIACLGGYHYQDADVNLEEVVRLLLDAGADPNLSDAKGMTPLILNARVLKIAQMLIAHGADVNAQAKDGFTALLNAETVELTQLLLEHGANVFAKDNHGETAFDWAKKMGRPQQAALLQAVMTGAKL